MRWAVGWLARRGFGWLVLWLAVEQGQDRTAFDWAGRPGWLARLNWLSWLACRLGRFHLLGYGWHGSDGCSMVIWVECPNKLLLGQFVGARKTLENR